jgi:ubiquinone/menaquinone biosynthesis C-methylase UbiE
MQVSQAPYSEITEAPGQLASCSQIDMIYTRYEWARKQSYGKDVLEVACGTGIGLGYLADKARSVVGGDIDPTNLEMATRTYSGSPVVKLQPLDAHHLPFVDGSFDSVLLFEAIYYLEDAQQFLAEAYRVLRPSGKLFIVSVNPEWHGFNPSPYVARYFDAAALSQMLCAQGFGASAFLGYEDRAHSLFQKALHLLKRTAVRWKLIPSTLKGRAVLKRIFHGRLMQLPNRLPERDCNFMPQLIEWNAKNSPYFKNFYIEAVKPEAAAWT